MVRREWRPGVMHAVIFLGFMSLLLRKLQLIAIGYRRIGVVSRRLRRPVRGVQGRDRAGRRRRGAVRALPPLRRRGRRGSSATAKRCSCSSLILAIMVTDFAFDGFRFALLAERFRRSPTSAPSRSAAARSPARLARAEPGGAAGRLRARLLDADGRRVLVPRAPAGRRALPHRHRAADAVLPARPTGPTACRRSTSSKLMEATDEADMQAGVRSARDLTWKDGLDAFTCTECGRCKDACPTHLTGKPLSLKGVNDRLKHHLLEQRDAIVARPGGELPRARRRRDRRPRRSGPAPPAATAKRRARSSSSTSTSSSRMRQHQVMIEGEFPHELKKLFEAYEVAEGNPWGLQADARGDWAHGPRRAGRAHGRRPGGPRLLFYVGSAMSFDPRGQTHRPRLRAASCAGPACASASSARAKASTGEMRPAGRQRGAVPAAGDARSSPRSPSSAPRRIVTCDPHALNSLRNEYPELGGHYEVLHHTAADRRAARRRPHRDRRLGRARRSTTTPATWGGTTASSTRRAPSSRASARHAPLEFALRARRRCAAAPAAAACGSTRRSASASTSLRVEQALETSPQTIATACPYCAVMMEDGLAALPAAARPGRATSLSWSRPRSSPKGRAGRTRPRRRRGSGA